MYVAIKIKAVLFQSAILVGLFLILPSPFAYSQGDCYFQDNDTDLVLGNSKVKIRFSKTGGRVLDLINQDTGYDFVRDDAPYNPSSYFIRYHHNASKWNASHKRVDTVLATGWDKPLTRYVPEYGSDYIRLEMDNKVTLGSGECTVTQIVKVFDGDPFTRWSITIDNPAGTGKTVVSVTYPHLRGINVLGGDDYFIAPKRRGERWEEFYFPREISGGPTYHIRDSCYPLAPWQWIWYGNSQQGLYLAARDTAVLPKMFRFGYDDRDMSGQRYYDDEMAITHFPFLEPGGTWTSYETEVCVKRGPGWYWGADRYRDFMENTAGWTRTYPTWAEEAHSLCWGPIDNYVNYPPVLRDDLQLGAWESRGNHNFMDQSWFTDGNPEYYWPRFVVNEAMGGYSALENGMAGTNAQGDRVVFFTVAHLADQDGNWFAQNPNDSVIRPDGQRVPRSFWYDHRNFYDQCFWGANIRDTVISDHMVLKNAGVGGAWLDCLLVFGELFCYDSSHGHSSPAYAMGPGAVGFMQRLNDEVWRRQGEGTDRLIGIEAINDFLIPYVDLWGMHHMAGYQGQASDAGGDRDYPEVARYLLPGVFWALKEEKVPGEPDDTKPFPQASFTFGCKLSGPTRADNWKYYNAYDAVPDAFYHGTFKADLGLAKSRSDFKAFSFIGSGSDTIVVTLWNRGSSQQSITISLDLAALGLWGSVTAAEDLMGRPLDWTPGTTTFTSTVPADDVTAVKLGVLSEPSPTPTPSSTVTHTPTPSAQPTSTPTPTITQTPTITSTPTMTPIPPTPLPNTPTPPPPPNTPTPTITSTPPITPTAVARLIIMKEEGLYDTNLYCYNSLVPGDWTYWDSVARNPSPVARDLWMIPFGNDAIGTAAVRRDGSDELYVLKEEGVGDINLYLYNSLVEGDWTYWDALERNPLALARDLWVIPSGNDALGIAAVDISVPPDGIEELAILKMEGVNDVNIYYYNALAPGDWTYWDAISRNPSPVARDLWVIPSGNDAIGLTATDIDDDVRKELAIVRREGEDDLNLYFYRTSVPGDWTYWDAVSRNPSPLARDLWMITSGNDAIGLSAIDIDGGKEELAILKKENLGDVNIYYYKSLEPGDWTYWDSLARNPSPLARDLWSIPRGNDAEGLTTSSLR